MPDPEQVHTAAELATALNVLRGGRSYRTCTMRPADCQTVPTFHPAPSVTC